MVHLIQISERKRFTQGNSFGTSPWFAHCGQRCGREHRPHRIWFSSDFTQESLRLQVQSEQETLCVCCENIVGKR